ncbi:DUF1874 domain-containing protein [Candidatus Berkelbacteria bacterium]|nr:DUF1874 domain-containing protein [Candidatus Berkelbacteria bacterium]
MKKLLNAFSLNMLTLPATAVCEPLTIEEAKEQLAPGFDSAVGHETTARALSLRLGVEVPSNRVNVKLEKGESAIVAQVVLPRLAEGQLLTDEQMAEAPISFVLVTIQ